MVLRHSIEISAMLFIKTTLEDPGADSGAEDENQNGREKIRREKYERKIRAPGDKLFTHQFQTAKDALKQVYVHISVEAGVKF